MKVIFICPERLDSNISVLSLLGSHHYHKHDKHAERRCEHFYKHLRHREFYYHGSEDQHIHRKERDPFVTGQILFACKAITHSCNTVNRSNNIYADEQRASGIATLHRHGEYIVSEEVLHEDHQQDKERQIKNEMCHTRSYLVERTCYQEYKYEIERQRRVMKQFIREGDHSSQYNFAFAQRYGVHHKFHPYIKDGTHQRKPANQQEELLSSALCHVASDTRKYDQYK